MTVSYKTKQFGYVELHGLCFKKHGFLVLTHDIGKE